MPWLVALLTSLFGWLVDRFVSLFNIISRRIFIPGAFIVNLAVISALGAFFTSAFIVYKKLVDHIYSFFDLLNSTTSNTSGLAGTAFSVLKSVGFFQAVADAFNGFLPILTMFFSLVVLKAILKATKEKRDYYWWLSDIASGADMGKDKGTFFRKKK